MKKFIMAIDFNNCLNDNGPARFSIFLILFNLIKTFNIFL
jgi:hypothetical protein